MLPSGFEWRHNGLWVNGTLAALCAEVPAACRVELRVGRIGHRITFQPDMEHGHSYVEAWAQRWEAEIREAYSVTPPHGWQMLRAAPKKLLPRDPGSN